MTAASEWLATGLVGTLTLVGCVPQIAPTAPIDCPPKPSASPTQESAVASCEAYALCWYANLDYRHQTVVSCVAEQGFTLPSDLPPVELSVRGGDLLLEDDLRNAFAHRDPPIYVAARQGDGALAVYVEKLRFDEVQSAERTETVAISRYDIGNVLAAALLMPNYSSYLFERTTGEASIEYAFAVWVQRGKTQLAEKLLRDTIRRVYAFCTGARIQNTYGGVQPAPFVANDNMKALCLDTAAVRVQDLREQAFAEVVRRIAEMLSDVRAVPTSAP